MPRPYRNLYEIVGPGASFSSVAPAVAASRAVVTVVTNLRPVFLFDIEIVVGDPPTYTIGANVEWGILNKTHPLITAITAGSTEVGGVNFVHDVVDVTAKGAQVVSYQSFQGRRGDTLVGSGALTSGSIIRGSAPQNKLAALAAAGLFEIPVGCLAFFASTVVNLPLAVNAYGREDTTGRLALPV